MSGPALWHDVECGAYGADLALWVGLAEQATGPVLELGCGTGRVALELARAGVEVAGVDLEPELIAALRARAEEQGLEVDAIVGDARELALGRQFALVLAPMQLAQLLGGAAGRRAMLRGTRAHLSPGGRFAAALLAASAGESPYAPADADCGPGPLPDVREHEDWVYSSFPVAVERLDRRLEIRRLRQTVSPGGELSETLETTTLDVLGVEELEGEAAAEGFLVADRLEVPPTEDHVGSTVIVLEAR